MADIAPASKTTARLLLTVLLVAVSSPALAEFADKEPTTLQLWLVPIIITGIAFLVATKRPSLALLLVPISLFCAWGQIEELHGPFVGPAIEKELGSAYFIHAHAASAVAVIGPIVAWASFLLDRTRSNRR